MQWAIGDVYFLVCGRGVGAVRTKSEWALWIWSAFSGIRYCSYAVRDPCTVP